MSSFSPGSGSKCDPEWPRKFGWQNHTAGLIGMNTGSSVYWEKKRGGLWHLTHHSMGYSSQYEIAVAQLGSAACPETCAVER